MLSLDTEGTTVGRTKISLNLLDEEKAALEEWAEEEGATQTDIIRRALATERYLEDQQRDGVEIVLRRGRRTVGRLEPLARRVLGLKPRPVSAPGPVEETEHTERVPPPVGYVDVTTRRGVLRFPDSDDIDYQVLEDTGSETTVVAVPKRPASHRRGGVGVLRSVFPWSTDKRPGASPNWEVSSVQVVGPASLVHIAGEHIDPAFWLYDAAVTVDPERAKDHPGDLAGPPLWRPWLSDSATGTRTS